MNRVCAFENCDNPVDTSGQTLEVFDSYVRPARDRQNGTFAKVCKDCFKNHDILRRHHETPQPPVAANFQEREEFEQTVREIWGPDFLENIALEATSVY